VKADIYSSRRNNEAPNVK